MIEPEKTNYGKFLRLVLHHQEKLDDLLDADNMPDKEEDISKWTKELSNEASMLASYARQMLFEID